MSKLMKKSFSAMLVILLAITLTMTGDIPVANAETIRFDWSLTPHGINEKFSLVVPMKTSKKVTWTSSKKSVAVVNSKGIVTTKKAGKTIITGKVGNKKFEYKIAVAVKLNYEKFF